MNKKDAIKSYSYLLTEKSKISDNDIQLLYILKYLPKDKKIRILDAGCGNGRYAEKIKNKGYSKIFGLDLFPKLKETNFNYINGSLDKLPFEKNYFDFIYCNSAIYYLDDINKGFSELNRVLKKKGKLIITVPTKSSIFTLWRKLKRIFRCKSVNHLKGIKFYSQKEYVSFLKKNEFKIILIDGYRLSFFLYPLYHKFVRFCEIYLHINLPEPKNKITKSKLMRNIKSILGYHMIIVSKKN